MLNTARTMTPPPFCQIRRFKEDNKLVFEEFARGMAGEAQKASIHSEEDVTKLVNEIRKEMWERDYAGNA